MPHEIVTVDTLHEGWSRLLLAQIRLPDGRTMRREIEDHGMAVAVLPYDRSRRVAMLIRQFRAAVFHGGGAESVLEVPAGILDEDEPAACARREALEEYAALHEFLAEKFALLREEWLARRASVRGIDSEEEPKT